MNIFRKKISTRGQAFTLDVLISLIILIIGISILYYNYPSKSNSYYYVERISGDVVEVLAETQISDLCINAGMDKAQGCTCSNYKKLENAVCNPNIKNKNADMLSFFTEIISNGYVDGVIINDIIEEMFIEKNVIDNKRFGFAIIYTTPQSNTPIELYNSEQ